MFTGIIESLGTVLGVRREGTTAQLSVKPDLNDFPVTIGGSVSIDGICLTLERWSGERMVFSAVIETLERTTLGNITVGRRVNLERALVIGSRLEGHFVYGHVDGTGTISHDREMRGSILRTVSIPERLSVFMAEKGSVALDGVSVTIVQCVRSFITISLIPHTMQNCTLGLKNPGDKVNVECDIIARYLHRLRETDTPAGVLGRNTLLSVMERAGF